jgi:spermidine synthase
MDFYEIDPAIVIVAHTPRFFTYVPMAQQRAKVEPILGDARLQLSRTDRSYDVLVLDAYSSDAVPVHLLTREAVELYVSRLKPGGVLAFHISNRHMNLRPVLGGIAHELGLAAIVRADDAISTATGTNASEWVVLGRRDSDLGALMGDPAWERLGPTAGFKTWTDDYSSILTVLRR